MKKIFLIFCLFLIAKNAEAKVMILACEPEWGSLAAEIVGDKADIKVLTNANQNARDVDVKTVLVTASRGADLIFCSGGGFEKSWLPSLIDSTYNVKVMTDPKYILYAYDYVTKLPYSVEQSTNPNKYSHNNFRPHLNPHNIELVATEFTRRIKLIDPINANFYQKAYEGFLKRWIEATTKWEEKAQVLRGMLFVTNDDSWAYLADWLGLRIIMVLDPKTGAKPNANDLYNLGTTLKKEQVTAIIFARYEDKKTLFWVRDSTKQRMILLPFTVGGAANAHNLFQLFDTTVSSLLTDCSSGTCKTLIPKTEKR